MSDLCLARLVSLTLAVLLAGVGGFLLHTAAPHAGRALPRARLLGRSLSALCWGWVTLELWFHPIDFLAFLSPTMVVVLGVVCIPLTWVLLENLLCARALGGLMMLWPMPVILALRDYQTAWRLVPITLGYVSLTFGMFVVFHPWFLRVLCNKVAELPRVRQGLGVGLIVAGVLCALTALMLGKVVGE